MESLSRRSLIAAGVIGFGSLATACTRERTADYYGSSGSGALIGISMPTKNLERWSRDGANLKSALEKMGYTVELQYADNKVEQQNAQIQTMINKSPAVIIIGSIDGSALGPSVEAAKRQGIEVLAYDRLIRDTDAVSYYVTFDNYKIGQMQGQYIADTLDLEHQDGPFNFEPFAGSPDDNNASLFFQGAWDVLKRYVDAGKLACPSGKMPASADDWQSIGIQAWSNTTAQSEMENRLNSFYNTTTRVNAVLSPNDAIALGVTQALTSAGYTGNDWPVLTGQDADQASVQNIVKGLQTMTVFKDTRKLGERAAVMVDEIVKGGDVEVNDTESYDNGVTVIPSYLIDAVAVDKTNVKDVVVDSGYYTATEVGL
nr:sugar-binding protein [Actinomyces sp.]